MFGALHKKGNNLFLELEQSLTLESQVGMANYEKELHNAANGVGRKHPPNKRETPEKFNPTDLASFRASHSVHETTQGLDRFKKNAMSLVDEHDSDGGLNIDLAAGMSKGEIFAERVEQFVMIIPAMKATYSKIKKFQQRFFHFENLADQLDNVMYNIDGDPSSGLDDWGVGCFVDFVSYMDRPPANYSHKAVWVSDAKDYMKLSRGTKATPGANDLILQDPLPDSTQSLPELTGEELEIQRGDPVSIAPTVEFLPVMQLKNNLLVKDSFIEQTVNVFSFASVSAVYKEFMGKLAEISNHDANAMTEYYEKDSELVQGPKPFNDKDPSENSCYAVVQKVGIRAESAVTKLTILAEKMDELAPMWDEIKIRTQQSARKAAAWFLEDPNRRQQYIDKIKEIVNLFKEDGRDALVDECVLADSELATVMSKSFVEPVTDFLANMEQLAWEGPSTSMGKPGMFMLKAGSYASGNVQRYEKGDALIGAAITYESPFGSGVMLGLELNPQVMRVKADAPDPREYVVHGTVPILTLMDLKIPLTSDTVEMLMGAAAENAPKVFEKLLAFLSNAQGIKDFIKNKLKELIMQKDLLGFVFRDGTGEAVGNSDEDVDAFVTKAMRVLNGEEEASLKFLLTIPMGIINLIKKGIRMMVEAVSTVISPDLISQIGMLPDPVALGAQATEMIDEFVVSMEEKAEQYINDALDSIFSVTMEDIKETIPTMDEIKSAADNLQNVVMEEFESATDLFKKTESSIEAGIQQFYQKIGEKTAAQREELVTSLLEAAVHAGNSTVAQSILSTTNKEQVLKCAAAALGLTKDHFVEMAPGLLGAVDETLKDGKGVTERSTIITAAIKTLLETNQQYTAAQIEAAEIALQEASTELLVVGKVAMAKLEAAGEFTGKQKQKLIAKFGEASEAAVDSAMSIAITAKMAASFLYGLDVPDWDDLMPKVGGGESLWSDINKIFESVDDGWPGSDSILPETGVFQTFVTIGKMKKADILKTLTEAIKRKTPCPEANSNDSEELSLVEIFSHSEKKTLHQVVHRHLSSKRKQQRKNSAALHTPYDGPSTNQIFGPCDIHSSIEKNSCCCLWASDYVEFPPSYSKFRPAQTRARVVTGPTKMSSRYCSDQSCTDNFVEYNIPQSLCRTMECPSSYVPSYDKKLSKCAGTVCEESIDLDTCCERNPEPVVVSKAYCSSYTCPGTHVSLESSWRKECDGTSCSDVDIKTCCQEDFVQASVEEDLAPINPIPLFPDTIKHPSSTACVSPDIKASQYDVNQAFVIAVKILQMLAEYHWSLSPYLIPCLNKQGPGEVHDCQLPGWMKRELINDIPGIFVDQILLALEILRTASESIAEISGDLMEKIFENNGIMDATITSAMDHVDVKLLAVANYMAGVSASLSKTWTNFNPTIPSMFFKKLKAPDIRLKAKQMKKSASTFLGKLKQRFVNGGKDLAAAARQAGRKVAKFAKQMIRAMREKGNNALAASKEAGEEKMYEACVALQHGIANFNAVEAFEFAKNSYDTYETYAAMTPEERKEKAKSLLKDRAKDELVERYGKDVVARGELVAAAVLGDENAKGKLEKEARNELVKRYGEDAVKLGETMAKAATGDMDALADLDDQAAAMLYKQARVQLVAKVGEDQVVKAEAALEAIQSQLDPDQELSGASRMILEEEYGELPVAMGLNIVKALSGDTDALRELQNQAFDLMKSVARETAVCIYGEDNVQLAEIVIMSTITGDGTEAIEALKGLGEKKARALWDDGIIQEYGKMAWALTKVWAEYSQNGNQEMLTHMMSPRKIDLEAIKNSLGEEMMKAAEVLKVQALSILSSNGCVGDQAEEVVEISNEPATVEVVPEPPIANTCSCSNGAAATGAACTSNGANICTSCNSGYDKTGNTCVARSRVLSTCTKKFGASANSNGCNCGTSVCTEEELYCTLKFNRCTTEPTPNSLILSDSSLQPKGMGKYIWLGSDFNDKPKYKLTNVSYCSCSVTTILLL